MAADTSIVPTALTVASASCQYVIGRDNGLADQASIPIPSRLTPAQYTNSSAAEVIFLAQITGTPGVCDFEAPTFTDGQITPIVATFGGTTATIDPVTSGLIAVEITGTTGPGTNLAVGQYAAWGPTGETVPTSAWQFLHVYDDPKVTFSPAIRAFGFWGVDLGDWNGMLNIRIYYSDATTEDVLMPYTVENVTSGGHAPWNQSVTYIGLIFSKNVDRIDLLNSAAGTDRFAFDNFMAAISSEVTFPTPPVTPTVEPLPPGSVLIVCGPSLGPVSCAQSCPIPVPVWPVVVVVAIRVGWVATPVVTWDKGSTAVFGYAAW